MTGKDCTDIYDRLGRLEATVTAQGERFDRVERQVDGVVDKLDGVVESTARIEEKLTTALGRIDDQETRMRRLQRWAWGLPSAIASATAAAIAGWKL